MELLYLIVCFQILFTTKANESSECPSCPKTPDCRNSFNFIRHKEQENCFCRICVHCADDEPFCGGSEKCEQESFQCPAEYDCGDMKFVAVCKPPSLGSDKECSEDCSDEEEKYEDVTFKI